MNIFKLIFIMLISQTFFAQDFNPNWKIVQDFEAKQKIKSALKEVENIFALAQKSKNEQELVRCFFYKAKYMQTLEEDAQTKIFKEIENIKNKVSKPTKAILDLIYADALLDYYQNNSWQIQNRTNLENQSSADFKTWTTKDFYQNIEQNYQNLLKDEKSLNTFLLYDYHKLFDFSPNKDFINRTIYDFVLEKNIEFYHENDLELNSISLKYNKSIADYSLYYQEKSFLNQKPNFEDQRLNNIINLLQKRENLLKNDLQKQHAFWDRFNLIHQIFNHNESYFSSLKNISETHKNNWLGFEADFKTADYYYEESNKKENINFRKKALEICNQIIDNPNSKDVKIDAENLKSGILRQKLSITISKYVLPNEPILARINYQNINSFEIKIYELPIDFNNNFRNLYGEKLKEAYQKYVKDLKIFTSKSYPINDLQDYFEYEKEFILPQLPIGKYLLEVATNSNIDEKSIVTFEKIQSTSLTVTNANGINRFFEVKDSKTGKPIKDVKVEIKNESFLTNEEGIVKISKNYGYSDILVKFEKDNDVIYFNEYFYNNRYEEKIDFKNLKITILTDRAIYRPTQKVYFKTIVAQSNEEIYQVIPNRELKLIARDSNGKEVFSQVYQTNEMGSFSGEFILPKDVLTGNFSLSIDEEYLKTFDIENRYDNFATNFKVEEYKRPKFEVTFETQKDTNKLNENITTKGKAKAFAGNNIQEATVKYTVTRKTQRRWNYRYYRGQMNNELDETIINGETKTDQNGNFSIDFLAKAGSQEAKNNPIYLFEITANVTDANGETQSNSTTVKVGYHNWDIGLEHTKTMDSQVKNTFKITTNNLNGVFVPTLANFTIYKLKSPTKVLLNRPWEAPEIQEINELDFAQNFPFYPYKNEDKKENWERGTAIFSKNINTETEKEIVFDNFNDWLSGAYVVELIINDKDGKEIKTQSYFDIFNNQENKPADNQLFEAAITNLEFKKDQFILINTKSNYPNLTISIEAFHESKSVFKENVTVENQKNIKIPIVNIPKGNVLIEIDYVIESQYFEKTLTVEIPSDEPKLTFKTNTFRNKLEPDSQEKWSFAIDAKHTPNFAEVLASMYDASLDKFYIKNWDYNLVNKKFIQNFGNQKNQKTIGINHFSIDFPNKNIIYRNLEKDAINTYGFGINYSQFYEDVRLSELSQYKKGKNIDVSGFVTVRKNAKSGVKVEILGTEKFVITDKNGFYKIKAKTGEVLKFSNLDFALMKLVITQEKFDLDLIKINPYHNLSTFSREGMTGTVATLDDDNGNLNYYKGNRFSKKTGSGELLMSSEPTNTKSDTVIRIRGFGSINGEKSPLYIVDGVPIDSDKISDIQSDSILNLYIIKGTEAIAIYGVKASNGVVVITTNNYLNNGKAVTPRTNFSETAFFFPHLTTDSKGNVNFEFKTPDALTQWKLRLLVHNKNGVAAYHEDFAITQKELMVTPNMPRFLREKDQIVLTTKITNLSNMAQKGKATLKLFNALNMKPVDAEMQNENSIQNFEIPANGNTTVSWKVFVPNDLQGVQYQVLAQTATHSDGEENILPVLPNSMLVTESKPIWVRENTVKTFTFNNFKDHNSNTLRHHLMTLEYTSNPTWLAIQSLPYLMEYEHECAEQTFARYYANALATEIINSQPKIKEVFENWKKQGKPISKLAQNEELKSIIIAETPWLREMENQNEQRKNLALLFDLELMKTSLDATLTKLKAKQKSNGAFAWFDGGSDNRYITQHIVSGLGHLNKLLKNNILQKNYQEITAKAIPFLDAKFIEDYQLRKDFERKNKAQKWIWNQAYNELHYFYARSFFVNEHPISSEQKIIFSEYFKQMQKQWTTFSLYEKAMAALVLHRFKIEETPKNILTAFRETSSNNEEWGMYWIANKNSWYWYQSPIETQAIIIEAFTEIENDTKSADLMKVWLIKNKQTKSWSNTKATTEAIYALLLQGSDFVNVKNDTKIVWGNAEKLAQKLNENPEEIATGYIKIQQKANEISSDLATISIENNNKVPSFGGIYWQYFEDLDQIKSSENGPMTLQKELYLKKANTNNKPAELQRITSQNQLKIGEKVTVRLIITSQEDMDYVHLKDMRASCFEPVDVLSGYQWQNGLGYYKSTKDAATHFFFDQLNKGTYVLEYEVLVNNQGDFSNGISTLQSMYAPEYSHHTAGLRVKVE